MKYPTCKVNNFPIWKLGLLTTNILMRIYLQLNMFKIKWIYNNNEVYIIFTVISLL